MWQPPMETKNATQVRNVGIRLFSDLASGFEPHWPAPGKVDEINATRWYERTRSAKSFKRSSAFVEQRISNFTIWGGVFCFHRRPLICIDKPTYVTSYILTHFSTRLSSAHLPTYLPARRLTSPSPYLPTCEPARPPASLPTYSLAESENLQR